MRPARSPWIQTLLVAAVAATVVSCGGRNSTDATSNWDAVRGDEFEVVGGTATLGRDAWVGAWYGRESPAKDSARVLGDERAVIHVSTPSHLAIPLGKGEPRRFTSALRRDLDGPVGIMRAEVFWESSASDTPQSLAVVELDDSTEWFPIEAAVPATAGTLKLLVRFAAPGQATAVGPSVSWANPRVTDASPRMAKPELPDIILVTVDTLRADMVSSEQMPWTTATIARGQSWPAAVSSSNWTLPSYGSLWTGLPAAEHGAGRAGFSASPGGSRDFTALHAHLPTFVRTLVDAGYASCMVHQNPFLEPWTGLSRDFDRWVRVADAPLAGREVADAWWAQNADRPRLLVLHFFAPHFPYAADAEIAAQLGLVEGSSDDVFPADTESFLSGDHTPSERAQHFDLTEEDRNLAKQLYAAEARVLDHQLSEWLGPQLAEAWDSQADTRSLLFGFHADHGEELWDAGSFEHGHSFDDSVVRVPMSLVWPGRIEVAVDARPVPARLLGMEILRALSLQDASLPKEDLGPRLPQQSICSHPLYRSDEGGRIFSLDGSVEVLDFDGRGSSGNTPSLPPAVARQLAELGYAED